MRFELYQYSGGDWFFLDECDELQEIVARAKALAEQRAGRVLIIDNRTAGTTKPCKLLQRLSVGRQETYDLLLACKLSRLCVMAQGRSNKAPEPNAAERLEGLRNQAIQEVAHLLGWETMRELMQGDISDQMGEKAERTV